MEDKSNQLDDVEYMKENDYFMARRVAEAVDAAGGRTFFVGGFVRDRLLQQKNKDIDIEVHGIQPTVLEEILDSLGGCTKMGASFGVYGIAGCTLDIAMPRREEATGRGHRDFTVYVDPYLGTEKAARRRDFTMNAMMEDVLTGQIVDHFGGWHDLREGVLHCAKCRGEVGEGISMPLTPGGVAALRHIVYGDPKRLFSFQLDPESLKQLGGISEAYLMTQLERGFGTLDFYKSIRIDT